MGHIEHHLREEQLLVEDLLDVLGARHVEAAVAHHDVQPPPVGLPVRERLQRTNVARLGLGLGLGLGLLTLTCNARMLLETYRSPSSFGP